MQGIEFETDQSSPTPSSPLQPSPQKQAGMVRLLLNLGIADANTANFILLGIAAIFFGVAIFLYAGILGEPQIDHVAKSRAALIMQSSSN